MPLDGKMAEEGCDFFFAHLGRMTLLMEEDVAPDPVQIELFSAQGHPKVPADAIEQLGRRGRNSLGKLKAESWKLTTKS